MDGCECYLINATVDINQWVCGRSFNLQICYTERVLLHKLADWSSHKPGTRSSQSGSCSVYELCTERQERRELDFDTGHVPGTGP